MVSKPITEKAMILARGLGTRMQKDIEGLSLDQRTAQLADQGLKGLIPVGRPFLDHTLQALLDAGFRDFCLIVPPGASAIRSYYEAVAANAPEVSFSFAEQAAPRGTADAVAAGRSWAGESDFLVLNSDNFYSAEALRLLAAAPAPATLAYEREALIAGSNIPADRIRRFGMLDIDGQDRVRRIVEKPDDPEQFVRDGKLYISMNCFLFSPEIFPACAAIQPHPVRKEYELPSAIQYCIDVMHVTYTAVRVAEGVLDLTSRADIEPVRRMLAGHEISFPSPGVAESR